MKVQITEAQLRAIIDIINDVESMIGCSSPDEGELDWDAEMTKRIRLIDRFLKKNKYER